MWHGAVSGSPRTRRSSGADMKPKIQLLSAIAASLFALPVVTAERASALECPWRPMAESRLGPAEMQGLLPTGNPLDDPARMNLAVDTLRRQGLAAGMIVDALLSAYCPVVAA